MNQQRIGAFLKHLRKSKGLTQDQLAEQFHVSTRTVSRWETGSNMPDVDILIELATFYDVDIREIMAGEKLDGSTACETSSTLKSVAAYAAEKESRSKSKVVYIALITSVILNLCTILFSSDETGLLYGFVPSPVCKSVLWLVYGIAICLLVSYLRAHWFLEKPSQDPERTVTATVLSKEVKRGTHQAGRSKGGYSYTVTFITENGQELELFTYEIEFGSLKEGMKGALTYQGRYFVTFN